jgi:hypothetical protein
LEQAFETIIGRFLEHRVGQIDNFLEDNLGSHLRENVRLFFLEKQIKIAGFVTVPSIPSIRANPNFVFF